MLFRFRPCFTSAVLILLVALPLAAADDSLSSAASLIRAKQYDKAQAVLAKADASPQRTFMLGMTALRHGNAEKAFSLLKEAETTIPQLADYALLYQAEALLKLGKYSQAAATAAALEKRYPASLLIRQAQKLTADSHYQSSNFPAALAAYQTFITTYRTGNDSAEATFVLADCKAKTGDERAAAATFRSLWLEYPLAPYADKAAERLKEYEKKGMTSPYTAAELMKRGETLYSAGSYRKALQTMERAPLESLSASEQAQHSLKRGKAAYKLRDRKQAEALFSRAAAASALPETRAEARYWQGLALERLDRDNEALALYTSLITGGGRQSVIDDAIIAAAAIYKGEGLYQQAIALYEKLLKEFPRSTHASRARWEAAWCRYCAGDFAAAATAFKTAISDDGNREKALYWLARSLEQQGKTTDAAGWYSKLLAEYEAGFYATWYREQHKITDQREPLTSRLPGTGLPLLSGFDKPKLLSSLGLAEEARAEMRALRKNGDESRGIIPGIIKVYLELEEYGSAIALFQKNRPAHYERQNMPLWSAGYPLVYDSLVTHHATLNGLSPGLVYGLMRAESAFNPTIQSPAGALGLMQLMPATAKLTAKEKGTFNPQRLVEPAYNITLGTRHLKDLLKEYNGEAIYTIAAYNAGANAVARWRKTYRGRPLDEFIENIPYQETRDYVKKVYASAATYRRLYNLK